VKRSATKPKNLPMYRLFLNCDGMHLSGYDFAIAE
jgi:hypothetical protein